VPSEQYTFSPLRAILYLLLQFLSWEHPSQSRDNIFLLHLTHCFQ
jgi:hypothetical protein